MNRLNLLFRHRFGPLAVLGLMVCVISLATRIVLIARSWPSLELNPLSLLGIFIIGLFYDLVVASFFAIPVALYCWLMKDSWYRRKWNRAPLFLLFFLITIILVFDAAAEIAFWGEYSVRFNFIAVDYLIYTTEVIDNILQSYNIPLIASGIMIVTILVLLLVRKKIIMSQQVIMNFAKRSLFFLCFMILPLAGYFLINNRIKNFSNNNYVNELSGNGIYEFGTSYWNNELDYTRFYAVRNDTANLAILRRMLAVPGSVFTSNPLSIQRTITADSTEHRYNVVLISVESLSGDYMAYFGNKENITPYLDSLVPHSLFFSNFYATGTRTVRGLEALSLSIPPTPGQSIVRRPNNENLFTMGRVLGDKGYDVHFIYGGNSFFDNMGYFFSHNGYKVLDKRDIPDSFVHHTTAWGIDDEAAYNYTLKQCDKSYEAGKPFFNHIMTISNHRPYTFPDGRIDIPSSSQTIAGGVKYTDYAIHAFLENAKQKAWFNNTLFVIVADHCAKSAGKTDLPVNRYHIPCFVYAPSLLVSGTEKRLTSQIDLAPTILGLMNMSYTSLFMGYDMFRTPSGKERVFISTYQDMGYVKGDSLVILSPRQKISSYKTDFQSGTAIKIANNEAIVNEAIAWYEGASWLFKHNHYKYPNN